MTLFSAVQDDSWIFPSNEKADESVLHAPLNTYLSFTFHQNQLKRYTTAVRASLFEMFRDFGSLLALVIRFTSLAISTTQGFSLSNSLIKKLYSTDEPAVDPPDPAENQPKNAGVFDESDYSGDPFRVHYDELGLSDSVALLDGPPNNDKEQEEDE